jgi:hypothetical protein
MTAKLGCYHVTGSDGSRYGVACTGKRDALMLVQARMTADETGAQARSAERVASCDWDYATVLRYV